MAVGVGVSLWLIPGLGWIVIIGAASHAAELNKAYHELWDSYNDLVNQNTNEATLIKFVQTTVHQLDNILQKIEGAIAGMAQLSKMFQKQKESYTFIRDGLGSIKDGVNEADANIRKAFVSDSITDTVEQITHVSYLRLTA